MLHRFSFFEKKRNYISVILCTLIVAIVGTYLLVGSHAATPYTSTTVDKGNLAGGARQQVCSSASDGNCVTFGPSSATNLAIHIQNGQLVNQISQPMRLLGVNATGTEWDCAEGGGISPGSLDSSEAAAMKTWHVNVVRIPLNEDCWLGINGVSPAYSGVNYQNAIRNWVNALNNAGIVAILDLHLVAPSTYKSVSGGGTGNGTVWPIADEDHAPTFWTQVASNFASDPAVIFEVYNEPQIKTTGIDGGNGTQSDLWNCWLNGCSYTYDLYTTATDFTPVTYQTAGMQQLVDTVRATGAKQPIMVPGLSSANNECSAWLNNHIGGTCTQLAQLPTDPLNQLALSFHNYLGGACDNVTCWNSLASVTQAAGLPIITGEFGESDCGDSFVNSYMNWADQNNVSYLAWAWQVNKYSACMSGSTAQDIQSNLQLLQSSDGTPSSISPEAAAIMSHLQQIAP
jgi:endoglucanase